LAGFMARSGVMMTIGKQGKERPGGAMGTGGRKISRCWHRCAEVPPASQGGDPRSFFAGNGGPATAEGTGRTVPKSAYSLGTPVDARKCTLHMWWGATARRHLRALGFRVSFSRAGTWVGETGHRPRGQKRLVAPEELEHAQAP